MMARLVNFFAPQAKERKKEGYNLPGKRGTAYNKSASLSAVNTTFAEFFARNRNYLMSLAFLAVVSFFFSNLVVLVSFIAIGVASRYYQKFMPHLQFGIETCLFGTVLSSIAFGWHAGALVGIISLAVSVFFTEEEASYLPVALIGMASVAFIASVAPIAASNILFWGVALTLFYDITTCAVYVFVFHADIFKTMIFIATHVAFNYFVFANFGAYVFSLLL